MLQVMQFISQGCCNTNSIKFGQVNKEFLLILFIAQAPHRLLGLDKCFETHLD